MDRKRLPEGGTRKNGRKERRGRTIVTDPKREAQGGVPISYYDEILKRYGVKMVLTNHPKAAPYWNPDFTIEDVTKAGPVIRGLEWMGGGQKRHLERW